jgi:Spy/CpxP family protein refolding chaperone
MRTLVRLLAGAAALSACVVVSSASLAQEPSPHMGMAPADMQHDAWADRMHEHAEAMAHGLHDILNVRPDQEAAFQAMLATMQHADDGDGGGMHGDRDGMERMTTPERLDRMAAHMAERQANFQRHADAVRRFYAVLSPEQQRAFDALQGMMMGGGRHGMGHMGHMGADDDGE